MITEEFKELVTSDVKAPCSDAERDYLMQHRRDWLTVLNKLKRDVEVQLAAQKARMTGAQIQLLEHGTKLEWLKYKEKEETWRVGAIRFMVSVEERMQYVKSCKELATV